MPRMCFIRMKQPCPIGDLGARQGAQEKQFKNFHNQKKFLLFDMQKTAVFPGSFDPITKGHFDIILRALPLFDQIIIAIGINSQKASYFPLEKRKRWIEYLFEGEDKIKVRTYEGLTVDFCHEANADYIVRGLRTSADFEFERGIAQMNQSMNDEIETVFLISNPAYSHITSTIVREILRNGGDAGQFVPEGIDLF